MLQVTIYVLNYQFFTIYIQIFQKVRDHHLLSLFVFIFWWIEGQAIYKSITLVPLIAIYVYYNFMNLNLSGSFISICNHLLSSQNSIIFRRIVMQGSVNKIRTSLILWIPEERKRHRDEHISKEKNLNINSSFKTPIYNI